MKKKRVAVAVVASCIALSATFSGCSLVSTINEKDMEQVIATVDISKSDKFAESGFELAAYKSAISSDSIKKRELVSYFINVGYSYVQNGSAVEDVFNMLMNALVENTVLTQYSTLALLQDKATNRESSLGYDASALATFTGYDSEVEKYEYLLGGEDSDGVKLAKYSLYSSINSAIDSYEKALITSSTEYVGTDTRTTPTNLETEQDDYDYYPKDEDGNLDYNIYTGYEGYLLSQSGAYKDDALEGTTSSKRAKAYTNFITYLRRNNLTEGETNLTDIWSLSYIQLEYLNQLKTQVVNKYYDIYEEQQDALLKDSGDYTYIDNIYKKLVADQTEDNSTISTFETAVSGMSSTSFVLYSPSTEDAELYGDTNATFGYVYNILLPYNARQSRDLTAYSTQYAEDYNTYYALRNDLLRQITTEDQRGAWFNGSVDYSFNASEADYGEYYGKTEGRDYLFFEGNLTDNVRYKELEAYYGEYSYNGSVYENEDGSYTLIGNQLTIDGMLQEFSSYINYVLGSNNAVTFDNGYVAGQENEAYYATDDFYKYEDGEVVKDDDGVEEIDYSKFVYATGTVDIGEFSRADLFNRETDQYKVMSAVNELQFAYTTDTGVLSQYIGYSVSAYETSYIKEFEYAAQLAVSKGAGSFAVCAGDYGWHLIYVTFAFDVSGGNVYTPDWENNIDKEGTFENLFYEWIKGNDLSDVTTARKNTIISDFNKESTVVKYQSRYQDLLDLGN